jgi:hypothetical protein
MKECLVSFLTDKSTADVPSFQLGDDESLSIGDYVDFLSEITGVYKTLSIERQYFLLERIKLIIFVDKITQRYFLSFVATQIQKKSDLALIIDLVNRMSSRLPVNNIDFIAPHERNVGVVLRSLVLSGEKGLLKLLFLLGADINYKQPGDSESLIALASTLHNFRAEQRIEMLSFLMQYGARIDNICLEQAAVLDGNEKVVEFLLQNGARVDFFYLENLVVTGKGNMIRRLVNAGASPDRCCRFYPPLFHAYHYHGEWLFRLLIECGADANIKNPFGQTILNYMTRSTNKLSILKILLAAGANPFIPDDDGQSIFGAFLYSDKYIFLLKHSLFHFAKLERGSLYSEIVDFIYKSYDSDLIKLYSIIEFFANQEIELNLVHVIEKCAYEDAVLFVENTVNLSDINMVDERGIRPIYCALEKYQSDLKYSKIIEMLVESGAEIDGHVVQRANLRMLIYVLKTRESLREDRYDAIANLILSKNNIMKSPEFNKEDKALKYVEAVDSVIQEFVDNVYFDYFLKFKTKVDFDQNLHMNLKLRKIDNDFLIVSLRARAFVDSVKKAVDEDIINDHERVLLLNGAKKNINDAYFHLKEILLEERLALMSRDAVDKLHKIRAISRSNSI